MSRDTIDFGIDLGTTNSCIALPKPGGVNVIKNNHNEELTPSAVWVDRHGRRRVGREAKNQVEMDPDNAFAEFKLQMGQSVDYRFSNDGTVMQPYDLSSEVLKSLRADVRQRLGEDIQASVICVPADFELPKCEATRRAAQLAGFTVCPLLQEPVAAALAYGFDSQQDKVFWLVYDMGGGTFDAAVVTLRDGMISVVNHGGDNQLGGKLIDWSIVEELLIPAVVQKHRSLTDFRRGNPKWRGAMAKLKMQAETAKILLSREEMVPIEIDSLCLDDAGKSVEFYYELKRQDVEKLAAPLILRSINICRKVLTEKRLSFENMEKILLVGGPTLMPFLRDTLADSKEGLGRPLEFSLDPMTVVAHGAAIFASGQALPKNANDGKSHVAQAESTFSINFPDWKFVGNDTEPFVAGMVHAPAGQTTDGLTIEFINPNVVPQWRSGKIMLAPNGAFMTSLWAEKGQRNAFTIELCDRTGRVQKFVSQPENTTYTIGLLTETSPLTHNVGIALVGDEAEWVLEKGIALPARNRTIVRTTRDVQPGQQGDVIRIPIIEGTYPRASRNRRVGFLEINAQQVQRHVPQGSEVEVTIDIDASRLLSTTAYIPILDKEFKEVIHLTMDITSSSQMRQDSAQEKERLLRVRQAVQQTQDSGAGSALLEIEEEQIERQIEHLLGAAEVDPDAADKADKRLNDLRAKLDYVEDLLEWPTLIAEADKLIVNATDLINQQGDSNDHSQLQTHITLIRSSIQTHDPNLLRQRIEELRGLVIRILDRKGILQALWFEEMQKLRNQMTNMVIADSLIAEGQRAINKNDVDRLRVVNKQLASLLPSPPPEPNASTVIRK